MFQKRMKTFVLMLMVAFSASLMLESVSYAQKSKRPSTSSNRSTSSKPQFGQSTKPGTSTKPQTGTGTKPPTTGTKPPTTGTKPPTTGTKPPTTPQFGQSTKPGTSTKPQTGTTPQFGQSTKPGTSTKPQIGTTPQFGQSNPQTGTGAKPPTSTKPSSPSSQRPGSNPVDGKSEKAQALSRAASQRRYEETKQATLPPKPSYTTPSGQTVTVRKDSAVSTIRSKPSSYYTPQQRVHRTEIHFNSYHYSHPYDYYYSRPTFYVGGGYSSAFWWMMSEWSAERRALWFYHNQANIEQAAYERGMQDQAVAAELARLQAEKLAVNSNYIDPEFSDNPDLMYSQEYVEAAYNPTVIATPTYNGEHDGAILIVFLCLVLGVGLFWLVFVKRWG